MAAIGAHLFLGYSPPSAYREFSISLGVSRRTDHRHLSSLSSASRSSAVTEQPPPSAREEATNASFRENGSFWKEKDEIRGSTSEDSTEVGKSLEDFLEESRELIRSDGGPPRWFSPLECGSRHPDSPLLLFLPGIDGTGLGLIMHHHRLGKIFDIWCMHIPVKDRTPFSGLVALVERTVRLENKRSPNRPIYLIGESLGACIALDIAGRNPDIDLALILANPATSFGKSQLQLLLPFMEAIPKKLRQNLPDILQSVTGENPLAVALESFLKALPLPLVVKELSNDFAAHAQYMPVLADMVPRGTLLWKLQMLNVASASANSHLHAVKAQTLILCSGSDQLLPSHEEGQRLQCSLSGCEIRDFKEKGHFLFLEYDDIDLVTVLKGASFYRRGKFLDYVSDYMAPTYSEFKKIYDLNRWIIDATSPVMLSTLENGKVVKGLGGIPLEGPVLLVGYHMLGGLDLIPLLSQFFIERNILVRGLAHPMNFRNKHTHEQEISSPLNITSDGIRMMGPVPVSGATMYKLFSSKAHVLLYPGGLREVMHRKGEEYKLFWPERCEFVRMAAQFGTKIVPFGAVGEDDFLQVVLDYNDLTRIPFIKSEIEARTKEVTSLRTDAAGEVANQDIHQPVILPKFPGRLYLYFGKPIETEGRKEELRDKEKAQEVYLQVKSEVERCMAFLKEKRERDPYRNLLPRLLYQASNGFTAEVPTFEL